MRNTLVAIALAALVMGCATFQQNAGKTLATIATTVDAAMTGWATYVTVSGTVTPAQQAQVKSAYEKYQACMATALAAYNGLSSSAGQPSWTQALTTLQAAQGTLTQLLNAFMPVKTTAPGVTAATKGGAK